MKYVLLFLAVFTTSAFAFDLGGDKTYNTANQTNLQAVGVDVSNRIANDTRAAASSFAAGGLGVGQGGVGQAVSGGSNSNVDFNITSPKNTPAVFSGNVYPTAPCMGSVRLSGVLVLDLVSPLALVGQTTSAASAKPVAPSGLGKADDALKVLCTSKYAAAAPSCAGAVAKE